MTASFDDCMISDQYIHGSRGRVDEVPMHDIGPGYAPIDQRNQRNKPPTGGVPIFPHVSINAVFSKNGVLKAYLCDMLDF